MNNSAFSFYVTRPALLNTYLHFQFVSNKSRKVAFIFCVLSSSKKKKKDIVYSNLYVHHQAHSQPTRIIIAHKVLSLCIEICVDHPIYLRVLFGHSGHETALSDLIHLVATRFLLRPLMQALCAIDVHLQQNMFISNTPFTSAFQRQRYLGYLSERNNDCNIFILITKQ